VPTAPPSARRSAPTRTSSLSEATCTPGGPLAGEHASTISVVLLEHGGEYEITAFHNTLITG
jgi:hypothetical protein